MIYDLDKRSDLTKSINTILDDMNNYINFFRRNRDKSPEVIHLTIAQMNKLDCALRASLKRQKINSDSVTGMTFKKVPLAISKDG